jgi:hypothetical protein
VHESKLRQLRYTWPLTFFYDFLLTQSLGKRSWWGCGAHVPAALDAIPTADRCACGPKIERDGKEYPPMAKEADWLVRNAAVLVLWTRGKRAAWSAEGVREEPLDKK